ncbi:MAG: COQ9 family protein [Rhodobacteraceae bacterium]|nr:MAG: COQ9 family protein [Paracoccaceae bacterium]|tara:strand:+ start:2247 stop:2936 length:690 start_codon:yes stop_codon:yes gene_type:complete
MVRKKKSTHDELIDAVIDKALKHVVFDGWSDHTFRRVCRELKINETEVRQIFPRGSLDLALAFHKRDDDQFLANFAVSADNKPNLRIRDRIESAINSRLELAARNKEAVKRSMSLLTTPFYFSEGTKSLWNTADTIWTSIGDKSEDFNWYSKRLTLVSVYSATLVFWMEDDSENFLETRGFIKRRIQDVMTIERLKSSIKGSPVWGNLLKRFNFSGVDVGKHKDSFPGW